MWFKVDDAFWSHPKVVAAGNAAIGLWVRAGSYSAQHLTDGYIPLAIAQQLGSPGPISRLVNSGLWTPADGGYVMHDWPEYQPVRTTVLQMREGNAERQRQWRARHQPVDNPADTRNTPVDNPAGDASYPLVADFLLSSSEKVAEKEEPQSGTEPQVKASSNGVTNSAPTRPVPDKEGTGSQQQGGRHARARWRRT